MSTDTEVLARILERLDRMEAKVDALHSGWAALADKVPAVTDAVATGAQFAWNEAEKNGIDPIATGERLVPLALDAASPDTLALLERLVARKAQLKLALDSLDRLDQKLADAGVAPEALAEKAVDVLARSAALSTKPQVDALLNNGALDERTIEVAAHSVRALVEVRREGFSPVSPFAVPGKLFDPDVQRATGFGLAFLKRLGQYLGR